MSSAVKATLVASIVLAANGFEATSANWEEQNKDITCSYRFETWQCFFSTSQSKNETNSCFACVSNLDMIPDGSFCHMGGSNHMGSSTVSLNFRASMSMNCKFCSAVSWFVLIACLKPGDCRRRRSWSRWTLERWHSWNFWCLRWDWDLRFLLLHSIRSHGANLSCTNPKRDSQTFETFGLNLPFRRLQLSPDRVSQRVLIRTTLIFSPIASYVAGFRTVLGKGSL